MALKSINEKRAEKNRENKRCVSKTCEIVFCKLLLFNLFNILIFFTIFLRAQDLDLMSGSCHLDRASIVEIGVECQIFLIVIFFNCDRVLQFGAHSRYYEGALTQKRSFLVICTTFRSDFCVG